MHFNGFLGAVLRQRIETCQGTRTGLARGQLRAHVTLVRCERRVIIVQCRHRSLQRDQRVV